MYVAKPQEQIIESNNNYFELFTTVEITDDMTWEVIGNKNQSIGSYSLDQLEQEKAQYVSIIAWIDAKISAIKALETK